MTEKSPVRLPLTFHETFLPERQYIRQILAFAKEDGAGDKFAISQETGIPTGKDSGKVIPTLLYATAMGLIAGAKPSNGAYAPKLTAFGEIVENADRGLDEPFTQWLSHLNLCRYDGGAELWFQVFAQGFSSLGSTFSEAELDTFTQQHNKKEVKLSPLVGMYTEPGSFAKSKLLTRDGATFRRQPPPIASYYARGYAYLLISLFDYHFPNEAQVTVGDFERKTLFFAAAGWNEPQRQALLDVVAQIGGIRVERQLGEAVITKLTAAEDHLAGLYDQLP
jgi:hypothetical protein